MRAGIGSLSWLSWLVALGGVLAYELLDPVHGVRPWLSLREELGAADRQRVELRSATEALEAEIGQLERDPFATERAVREVLGFARPGELVVRIPRAEPATAPLTATE